MTAVTVIGCGFMGENHVHAVADHPTLELESVVDVDSDRAKAVADQYGAATAETDYERAIADAEAVVVATPEQYHAPQAHTALDHQRHVLLEKPMTVDLSDANDLAAREEETDVVTGMSFILRYDPAYARARETVAHGELGTPIRARVRRGIPTSESRRITNPTHPVYYLSIHDIDMLRWCLDSEVERVQALDCWNKLDDTGVPDVISALLEFDNGAIGVLEASGVLPESTPGGIDAVLEIGCTDGQTTVDTPGSSLTIHGDQFDKPDTRHWPVINGRPAGAVSRQIDRFAAAIDGSHDMLATFEDGVRAQTVASTIESALKSDGPRSVEYR